MRRSVLEKLSVGELQSRLRLGDATISSKKEVDLIDIICQRQDKKRLEMEKNINEKSPSFYLDFSQQLYFAQELQGVRAELWDYDYGHAFVELFRYSGTPEEIAADFDRLVPEVDRFSNYDSGCKRHFGKRLKDSDLLPMMKAVSGKSWAEWTKADLDIIKDTMQGAISIQWGSTTGSNLLSEFRAFEEELEGFLKEHITLRSEFDPHVVIADALDSCFDYDKVTREIGNLLFPDCLNECVPEKTNASEKAFVWSFQTYESAQHFIKSLKEKVPEIRLMYIQSDHPVSLL